jgi:hypothetical protein
VSSGTTPSTSFVPSPLKSSTARARSLSPVPEHRGLAQPARLVHGEHVDLLPHNRQDLGGLITHHIRDRQAIARAARSLTRCLYTPRTCHPWPGAAPRAPPAASPHTRCPAAHPHPHPRPPAPVTRCATLTYSRSYHGFCGSSLALADFCSSSGDTPGRPQDSAARRGSCGCSRPPDRGGPSLLKSRPPPAAVIIHLDDPGFRQSRNTGRAPRLGCAGERPARVRTRRVLRSGSSACSAFPVLPGIRHFAYTLATGQGMPQGASGMIRWQSVGLGCDRRCWPGLSWLRMPSPGRRQMW